MRIAQGQVDAGKCIMLAICQATKRVDLVVSEIALMPTNRFFIPITTVDDCAVFDELATQARRFEKPMDYGQKDLSLPDFVLLDGEVKRIPMFILHKDAAPRRLELLRMVIEKHHAEGDTVWVWNQLTESSMPPLPNKRMPKPRTETIGD